MNNAQAEWTEDEIQALPSTTQVFDVPELVINDHQWQQRGYEIVDVCAHRSAACHPGALPIPSGKLLIKDEGGYRLVDELTRK